MRTIGEGEGWGEPREEVEKASFMDDVRSYVASRLSSLEKSGFLGTLLRVARANEISAAERNQLGPAVDWMHASEAEIRLAMHKADDATLTLDQLLAPFDELTVRILLFRECCSVAWVDGRCSTEEAALLEEIARLLRLDADVCSVLDSPLACSPEGERRFLELLELCQEARLPPEEG